MTFQMLRAGLSFVSLPPEARTALRAVRGAEVGVYHLSEDMSVLDQGALLSAADRAMAGRGWERLVGVCREHEFVAVYLPKEQRASAQVQAYVAVVNRADLVVVAARTALEPLLELAQGVPDWKSETRRPKSESNPKS